MLVFSHFNRTANAGDMASGPYRYFPFPDYTVHDLYSSIPQDISGVIVVGGGAVASQLAQVVERNPKAKVIGWGVGDTRHGENAPGLVPSGIALYGSREWQQNDTIYVPCASCMSPLFDFDYEITEPFALFLNAGKRIRDKYPVNIDDMPAMHNHARMEDVVSFLGSAETILTNSYHGAYWGSLLGRRVVIVNAYSSKFHGFRFQPIMATEANWKAAASCATSFPQALEYSRAANLSFHERVLAML